MSMPKTIAWWFMMLLAFAIGAYAPSYFFVPDMIDPEFKIRFDIIPLSARLHIIPGGLTHILGAIVHQ